MNKLKYFWLVVLVALALTMALWPYCDMMVTQYFYGGKGGFFWRFHPLTNFIHDVATGWIPKFIGVGLLLGLVLALIRKTSIRPWLYLVLALLLGSGLIANVLLKDNWGRARPLQIVEFGGKAHFTPYWQPTAECQNNCSFVNGDASFGFLLAAPALVIRKRRRLVFWSGTVLGMLFGVTRIIMGAHFLSDTVWSALLMLATMFALYALLYGRAAARAAWRAI